MLSVDQAHLFRLLLDRSSCPLVFVLGDGETEQLLDTAVVRLPRRRLFLNRGPHGGTICVYVDNDRKLSSANGNWAFLIIIIHFKVMN